MKTTFIIDWRRPMFTRPLRPWLALALSLAACATRATTAHPEPTALAPVSPQAKSSALRDVETDVPALTRPVTSFGAAAHGGALYVYGGYFGVPHAYAREGQSGDLVRVDVQENSETVVAVSEGVQGAQLVSSSLGLLRVGGMRAENAQGEREHVVSLADVSRFDERTRTWQALPSLPEPRSSHAAVLFGGELYVLGGWTLAGDRKSGAFAERVLVLDLESQRYRTVAQPAQLRAAQAAVLDDKIALIGGIDPSGKTLQSVHVLDPRTGTWTLGPELPSDAFGVAVASNGRALYASARDGVVYALEDVKGAWKRHAYLAFPRFFHQMVMLDDENLAVLGGISGMHHGSRIAHIERISTDEVAPRVLSFELRSPSPAKNRQGVQVIGDQLLVFGGNRSLEQHDFGPADFRADAFAIDLAAMRTEALPSYPVARQTVQTVALEGALLALGGFGHDGDKARSHADAYTYDFRRRDWAPHGSVLPSPRTQFGVAVDGEQLWIFGGLDYDPSRAEEAAQFTHPTRVLAAQRDEPFVETDVQLPRPRRAFAGAALEGHYYMVGGMADGFAPVLECDVFAFATQTWSTMRCPASSRISAQLVPLDGRLYLVGGSSPVSGSELAPSAALEVYDPKTDTWTTLFETIPAEPRHLSALAYRHALLLYSAHRSDDRLQVTLVVPTVGRE
jgi:N-acetylneuraminic acid mutarotase